MADTGLAGPGYDAPPDAAAIEAHGEVVAAREAGRTWLDRVFEAAVVVLMAVLVAAVLASTASRYVLNASVIWSEEIPILLQVWLTFLGGVVALRRGDHVSVDALSRLFPSRWQAVSRIVVDFLSFGLLAVLLLMSITLVRARSGEASPAVGFPMGLFMVPLVIGTLFMLFMLGRRFAALPPRRAGVALLIILGLASLFYGVDRLPGGFAQNVNPLGFLLASFVVLVALNMPISFALGVVSVVYLWFAGTGSLTIVAQRLVAGPMSFVLIAVPLFILAGALMEAGGISRRLVALASAMVGHIRGGLAMVVIVSEIFFSGISGSSTADVSAVGSLLIPAMKKAGYRGDESVAIVAAASAMGILVPPCILMVILAAVANISVIALFVGGFIPACVVASGATDELGRATPSDRRRNHPLVESGHHLRRHPERDGHGDRSGRPWCRLCAGCRALRLPRAHAAAGVPPLREQRKLHQHGVLADRHGVGFLVDPGGSAGSGSARKIRKRRAGRDRHLHAPQHRHLCGFGRHSGRNARSLDPGAGLLSHCHR